MRIVLGIESSCDETAVALVREDRTVLAQALATQQAEHAPFGGVVPEIAARAHLAQIDRLYRQALADAQLDIAQVDAVAATCGPGLIGGVMVGVMVGKAVAAAASKPFIGINHLEGHALTVRLTDAVAFPYFLLLISGGHCQQLVVRGVGDYVRLGGTLDDALGEAFDKCAKMLGLPYPGGPELERAARVGNPKAYALPRPLKGTAGHDFSFSGLKTAVRLCIEKEVAHAGRLTPAIVADVAASFEAAVLDVLDDRVGQALAVAQAAYPITALAVAGGVAANQAIGGRLRLLAAAHAVPLVVAPPALCTDNAAMIAWAGMERLRAGAVDDLSVQPRARWPLTELVRVHSAGG
ncbi:MAG: tRNA (adenosine(37)-N6)-threonylcarbamoyltransferase complex transferase subunit TsaD [Alphaproteobacteria bacterium]|nr:tRNA (adenosine(37)-N6)-threonylcarbamoyltransferase complex transferase subunit TsaD [Alphaproteobacteria bacterium]